MNVIFFITALIVIFLVIVGLPLFIMGLIGIVISLYGKFVEKEEDNNRLLTSTYITLGSSVALGLAIFISFCVENI